MSSSEKRPTQVEIARYHADHGALSAMGKKGAKRSALSRALEKAERERNLQEAILEKAKTETISAEGDVLPPDPKIIDSFKDR